MKKTAFLLLVVLAVNFSAAYSVPVLQLPWPAGVSHRINGGYTYGCGTHAEQPDFWALDFQFQLGEPVASVAVGTVNAIVPNNDGSGYGNYVIVDHGGGLRSRYAHLSGFAPGLTVGATIGQGQTIGYAGSTGNSTWPHLHFVFYSNGQSILPEPMSGVTGFGHWGISQERSCDVHQYLASPYWTVPLPPSQWQGSIAVNNGSPTTDKDVIPIGVSARAPDGAVTEMQFSRDNATWSGWREYKTGALAWGIGQSQGTKTVYARFRSASSTSPVYSASVNKESSLRW